MPKGRKTVLNYKTALRIEVLLSFKMSLCTHTMSLIFDLYTKIKITIPTILKDDNSTLRIHLKKSPR